MDSFDRLVVGIVAGLIAAIGGVVILGDHVGVRIADFYPESGSQSPATAPIRLTFGEAVDTHSVETRFTLNPAVEGQVHWEGNTLVFLPDHPLPYGQTVTVTLESGVESLTGRRTTKPLSWSFTPRWPGVLYLAPADVQVRNLWYIAVEGGEPRQVLASEYGVADFSPSPDGSQIAVTLFNQDMTTDIWLIEPDGGGARRITECSPGVCGRPTWSPDGALIAYERQGEPLGGAVSPSRVWLYDLASGQTSPVFEDNQVLGFTPLWSPDGARLAFFDANAQAIRVLTLTTGQVTLIPTPMGEVGTFSPDGNQLAYVDIRAVGRQYYPEVWLADLGPAGGLRRLFEDAQEDQFPAWSPDGQWLALARRRLDRQGGWASQVVIANPATGDLTQLTSDPAYNNTGFQWDFSSRYLLTQRFDLTTPYAKAEIWVLDIATRSQTKLVENGFGGQWLP